MNSFKQFLQENEYSAYAHILNGHINFHKMVIKKINALPSKSKDDERDLEHHKKELDGCKKRLKELKKD